MKSIYYHLIESKLADFICNDCKVSTLNAVEECITLCDWLDDGKDYIPFGSIIIKKGENVDMLGKAMEEFDSKDTPFKRVVFHYLHEESSGKISKMPIITGFQKGKRLELRMEF